MNTKDLKKVIAHAEELQETIAKLNAMLPRIEMLINATSKQPRVDGYLKVFDTTGNKPELIDIRLLMDDPQIFYSIIVDKIAILDAELAKINDVLTVTDKLMAAIK